MAFKQLTGRFEREMPVKNSGKSCRYVVGYELMGIQVSWTMMAWIDDIRIAKSHGLVDLTSVTEEKLIAFLNATVKATLQHAFFPMLSLRKPHTGKQDVALSPAVLESSVVN